MKNSFTLLEAIFSITILILTIVGAFALVQLTLGFTPITQQKLIASYLVQEGIEIVKNIRDTNWIEGAQNWDNDIFCCLAPPFNCPTLPCECNCQADYDTQTLSPYDGGDFLNIENHPSNKYGYGAGTPTKFKRKITVKMDTTTSTFQVLVEVKWEERGREHSVKGMENLYNWRQ
jgi:hypothetical protein